MKAADVVVVGAGVAGLGAALAARDAGATVLVVGAGAGGSLLAGGAWDVAPLNEGLAEALAPPRTLRRAIAEVARTRPHHPYAILDDAPARVAAAHERVLSALGGYRALDLDGHGLLVATDLGLLRRTASAQDTVLDLAEHRAVVVPALDEIAGWDGTFVASSLDELLGGLGEAPRFRACPVAAMATVSARRHAHELAQGGVALALVDALVAQKDGATAALLPALLPIDREGPRAHVERFGAAVGEVLSSLAGPQGLRLALRIDAALEVAGCTRGDVPASAVEYDGGDITLVLEGGERLDAGAVVLATGKYLGGGLIARGGSPVEALADLPLFHEGRVESLPSSVDPSGRDPRQLFGPDLFTGGPGWAMGVGYDSKFRALGASGSPASDRLFAAGALLSGVDSSRDGTGLGVCATTGALAGHHAAERAGHS